MLVFTDLPPPLGAMSLVWADVSLEAVNVSRKGASATKRFQNPSPSDLKTGAFPKQCHGPNTNSGTSPPLPGGERKELIFFLFGAPPPPRRVLGHCARQGRYFFIFSRGGPCPPGARNLF